MASETLLGKVVITPDSTDEGYSGAKVSQLKRQYIAIKDLLNWLK